MTLDDIKLVDDEWIHAIGRCTALEELDLTGCHLVTIHGISSLASSFGHTLKSLCLNSMEQVNDLFLTKIGESFSRLQKLSFEGCDKITLDGFKAIMAGVTGLQNINIGRVERVDDLWLEIIATGAPDLRVIGLAACVNITLHGIEVLANGCHLLEELVLTSVHNVQDSWIVLLNTTLRYLRHLDISRCNGVSKAARKACAEKNFHLVTSSTNTLYEAVPSYKSSPCLTLKSFAPVDRSELSLLQNDAVNLELIDLSGCPGICDADMAIVGSGSCKNLKHLSICGSTQVGGAGIMALASGCQRLEHIDMTSTHHVYPS